MFQRGSVVRVRAAHQILATLDDCGMLEGVPFSQQMLHHCGQVLPVQAKASAVCATSGQTAIRRMTDAYVLDIPRCSGHESIECDAGCTLIWKEAWLESSELPAPELGVECDAEFEIVARIQNHNAKQGDRFVCQATELWRASDPMSPFDLTQYVRERHGNKTSWSRIATELAIAASAKIPKLVFRRERVFGHQQSTPTSQDCYELDQAVRVKSRSEIESTLDRYGRNRGLWFDPEMLKFCGQVMRVSRIVKQVIDEKTGKLRVFRHPTIVLDEKSCTGASHRFCSRAALFYWRSVWVEAADETPCGGCVLANRRAIEPVGV